MGNAPASHFGAAGGDFEGEDRGMMPFSYQSVREFLEQAVAHYEKSAPALSDWLDQLYVALDETPLTVSALELMQLNQLRMDGEWEQPNYAQNRWYKVRALKGQDCGVVSY